MPDAKNPELQPYTLPKPHRPKFYTIVIIVAALAAAGALFVANYVRQDAARDVHTWQEKLDILADTRVEAVNLWVGRHFKELKKLSENPSLQLYITELTSNSAESAGSVEPAQKSYLRNLLIFTADALGFVPANVPVSLQIPTNIPYEAGSGLAVLDPSGKQLVSTPYLAQLDDSVMIKLQSLPTNQPALIDAYQDAKGQLTIGFVVPVFAVQADADSPPIARIVGIKQLDKSFFSLLQSPGVTEKTLKAVIARAQGANTEFLTLKDEKPEITLSTLSTAESKAIAQPRAFTQDKGVNAKPVFATARPIAETPWYLVLSVDRSEALAAANQRKGGVVTMLILAVGVVLATVAAVWYISGQRQAQASSRYFKNLADRATAQEQLLGLVSNSQPDAVYLLDDDNRFRFANRSLAKAAGMNAEAVAGKPIADVLGAARAGDIIATAKAAAYNGRTQTRIERGNDGTQEYVRKVECVPLPSLPLAGAAPDAKGTLVVEQDITEVVHERERRIRLHGELVDTLIGMVDKRDPHAANHSRLVAEIAQSVAEGMGLDTVLVETARISGNLMNIGKLVVPPEVLTKRENLSEEELKTIRASMAMSASIISGITFDGPVAETLSEAQEFWDGSGQKGLRGEGILITARIIGAVNAFVSMTSARAWRPALTVEEALAQLQTDADKLYDRKVIIALANFMENQGGRDLLKQWRTEPKAAVA